MLKLKNSRDFIGGVTMIFISLLFVWFGQDLQVGNAFQMGAGYFPMLLSLLLGVIGALMIMQSFVVAGEKEDSVPANWKAYALIIFGPIFFGLTLSGLGLAPTIFFMIIAVATASAYANWRHSILLGLFMAICSVILFTRLLSLPVSAFGPWVPIIGDLS